MAVFDDRAPEHKLVLYRHGVEWIDGRPEPIKAQAEPVELDAAEPLRTEMEMFLKACADPSTHLWSDGREGLRVLRVLDAAERSLAAKGLPVSPNETRFVHETAVVGGQANVGAAPASGTSAT